MPIDGFKVEVISTNGTLQVRWPADVDRQLALDALAAGIESIRALD